MTQHVTERLSDYLDGELDAAGGAAVERHLAACEECSHVLEDLRAVVLEARRLPDRPPPVDLWPGIAERLRPRRRSIVSLLDRIPGRRLQISIPQLAAAGLLLMLLSGGSVWLALRQRSASGPDRPIASRTTPPNTPDAQPPATGGERQPSRSGAPRGAVDANLASFEQAPYDAAVADLERALREHGSELDTATVRVLQQNLAIIDRAIEQARQALLADPANPYLNGHLAEQMKLKVRLLQRATGVVAAHG